MKLASWIPDYWTDEQRAVWQNVETHWEHLIGGNIEGFLQYIHPDFVGFGHESPIPVDYPWLEKWVGFWAQSTKIVIAELRPINMKLHGDIAILQYIIFTIEVNQVDQGKRVVRRYTMTWKKHDDLWKVIGSHNNLMSDVV